ncbi:MAG: flagellar basal body rod protein FlgC [Myxococcota bacterium]|nr:flagellar basal body rod protein FlgC [Myxococcota bacterium]
MDILDTLRISASGMTAQRVRLQSVASNMANARTTRTEDGGPYQRQMPVFSATSTDKFGDMVERNLARVDVVDIETSDAPGTSVYDPGHPDADEDGYVLYPNVDILTEMVDMMTTSRSYEANAQAVTTTYEMARQALGIGR